MRIGDLIVLLLASPVLAQTTTKPAEQETLLSEMVQLTSGFARAGEAYFSPDMKSMIFQASKQRDGHYQMYVTNLTWKGDRLASAGYPIRISPADSRNTCGYFSPDGKSIIFGSTTGKEKPDESGGGYKREGRSYVWSFPTGMEIFRADDWRLRVDSLDSVDHVNLATKPLTNNDVYDAECAFSSDGKWICFTRGAGKDADIYVMRAEGTGDVKVVAQPGYDGGPFFSPDGKRLVYRSDRKSNDLLQIFVADLTFDDAGNIAGSKNERQLTDDANVNWGPYWHPHGKHIVYATSKHGHANYELYLMQDDGSNPTRVTFWNGADVLPTFSPDGKWLLWTSKRTADQTTQVFAAKFKLPQ
jgi:Tol biopolymer transport system component